LAIPTQVIQGFVTDVRGRTTNTPDLLEPVDDMPILYEEDQVYDIRMGAAPLCPSMLHGEVDAFQNAIMEKDYVTANNDASRSNAFFHTCSVFDTSPRKRFKWNESLDLGAAYPKANPYTSTPSIPNFGEAFEMFRLALLRIESRKFVCFVGVAELPSHFAWEPEALNLKALSGASSGSFLFYNCCCEHIIHCDQKGHVLPTPCCFVDTLHYLNPSDNPRGQAWKNVCIEAWKDAHFFQSIYNDVYPEFRNMLTHLSKQFEVVEIIMEFLPRRECEFLWGTVSYARCPVRLSTHFNWIQTIKEIVVKEQRPWTYEATYIQHWIVGYQPVQPLLSIRPRYPLSRMAYLTRVVTSAIFRRKRDFHFIIAVLDIIAVKTRKYFMILRDGHAFEFSRGVRDPVIGTVNTVGLPCPSMTRSVKLIEQHRRVHKKYWQHWQFLKSLATPRTCTDIVQKTLLMHSDLIPHDMGKIRLDSLIDIISDEVYPRYYCKRTKQSTYGFNAMVALYGVEFPEVFIPRQVCLDCPYTNQQWTDLRLFVMGQSIDENWRDEWKVVDPKFPHVYEIKRKDVQHISSHDDLEMKDAGELSDFEVPPLVEPLETNDSTDTEERGDSGDDTEVLAQDPFVEDPVTETEYEKDVDLECKRQ